MAILNKTRENNEELDMMLLYAIKDNLNGFIPPVAAPNELSAKRWFAHELKHNTFYADNKGDYDLYYLGKYNIKTGMIFPAGSEMTIAARGTDYGNEN